MDIALNEFPIGAVADGCSANDFHQQCCHQSCFKRTLSKLINKTMFCLLFCRLLWQVTSQNSFHSPVADIVSVTVVYCLAQLPKVFSNFGFG